MPTVRKCVFDDLFKALTHELTQPLMSILSNARAAQHLLQSRRLDREQVQTILEDIARQDKRAGETVKRLGSLLGTSEAPRQPLYLDDVLRDALLVARGTPVAAGVEFRMKVAARLPPVLAHREQLRGVLVTLLHNACEATRRGAGNQPLVNIRVDVDSGMTRVFVEGRGHGIGTDHLERMMQEFFTLAPNPLILGLANCRLVLAAHDGYLRAIDKPRVGAVFHIAIPIFDGEVP
jgi:C4-dicarboxylate-specific signal transduction histidine kinase